MEWEDDLTGMEWKNRVGLLCIIRELNQGVFERWASTGSEDFSLLIRLAGLSLRAGGRGFSPATKRVAPGYFIGKQKKNRTKRNP